MDSWPEPIERVAEALRRSGVNAHIEEIGATEATAAEAAVALGITPAQIAETAIVLCDERPVATLVPSGRGMSLDKVRKIAGAESARLATATEVRDLTGFEAAALPPLPLPSRVPLHVDRVLLALKRIWVRAGSSSHFLSCAPADLVALTEAEVVDVIEADG